MSFFYEDEYLPIDMNIESRERNRQGKQNGGKNQNRERRNNDGRDNKGDSVRRPL